MRNLTDELSLLREHSRPADAAIQQDALDVIAELAHDCVLLAQTADHSGLLRFHRLRRIIHELCEEILVCEEKGVSREAILKAAEPARAVHGSSPFVRRLQEWPRGYSGDFETIDRMLNPVNRGEKGTAGYLCESYWLASPIAQQIRNRLNAQGSRILERCVDRDRTRLLSIGCGSCGDLQTILHPLSEIAKSPEFYLADRDPDALIAARERLEPILPWCHWISGEPLAALRESTEVGPFDLIVTGTLFDTLTDREIVAFLKTADQILLRAGGSMFFTNMAAPNPYRPLLEYVGNWFMVERSEDDLRRLCSEAEVAPERLTTRRDDTGLAILAEFTK